MDGTDGLSGMPVAAGGPLSVPISDQIKGRLLNVVGEPSMGSAS